MIRNMTPEDYDEVYALWRSCHHAGVRPEFRGRGIGTALVEAALEKLRTLGITKVGLLVFRDNDACSRFWEARGFAAREDLAYRSCVLREMTRIQF